MDHCVMQRVQISLTDEQRRVLDCEAARSGRSISALIRAAVDRVYREERPLEDDLAAMEQAFGCWSDRDIEAAAWVDEMRSGERLSRGPSPTRPS